MFDAQHELLLRLLSAGALDGVRVDHIDGLRQPAEELLKLRAAGARWIVVEKILADEEPLPSPLDADGTTGYEFADRACGVLADPSGEGPLTRYGGRPAVTTGPSRRSPGRVACS